MCNVNGAQGATPGMVNTASVGPNGTLNHGIAMNRYSLPSLGLHAPPDPAQAARFRPAPAAPAQGPFPVTPGIEQALSAVMPSPAAAQGVAAAPPAAQDPMLAAGQAQRFPPGPDPMLAAGQSQRFRPMDPPGAPAATSAIPMPRPMPAPGAPMVLPQPYAGAMPRPMPAAPLAFGQRVPLPNGGMGSYAAPGLAIADGDTMGRYVGLAGPAGGAGLLASIFGG